MRLSRRRERRKQRVLNIFTSSIPFTPSTPSNHTQSLRQGVEIWPTQPCKMQLGPAFGLQPRPLKWTTLLELLKTHQRFVHKRNSPIMGMPQIAPAFYCQLYSPYSVSAKLGGTDGKLQQSAVLNPNLGPMNNNNFIALTRQSRDRRRSHVFREPSE